MKFLLFALLFLSALTPVRGGDLGTFLGVRMVLVDRGRCPENVSIIFHTEAASIYDDERQMRVLIKVARAKVDRTRGRVGCRNRITQMKVKALANGVEVVSGDVGRFNGWLWKGEAHAKPTARPQTRRNSTVKPTIRNPSQTAGRRKSNQIQGQKPPLDRGRSGNTKPRTRPKQLEKIVRVLDATATIKVQTNTCGEVYSGGEVSIVSYDSSLYEAGNHHMIKLMRMIGAGVEELCPGTQKLVARGYLNYGDGLDHERQFFSHAHKTRSGWVMQDPMFSKDFDGGYTRSKIPHRGATLGVEGLVYNDFIQKVYDGDFEGIYRHLVFEQDLFKVYIKVFSETCAAYLPKNARRHQLTKQVLTGIDYGYYRRTFHYEEIPDVLVKIDPKYYDLYMKQMRDPGFAKALHFFANPEKRLYEINGLFSDNLALIRKNGCGSPKVTRYLDNLTAYIEGRAPKYKTDSGERDLSRAEKLRQRKEQAEHKSYFAEKMIQPPLEQNRFYALYRGKRQGWCDEPMAVYMIYVPETFKQIRYQLDGGNSGRGLINSLLKFRQQHCPNVKRIVLDVYSRDKKGRELSIQYSIGYDAGQRPNALNKIKN